MKLKGHKNSKWVSIIFTAIGLIVLWLLLSGCATPVIHHRAVIKELEVNIVSPDNAELKRLGYWARAYASCGPHQRIVVPGWWVDGQIYLDLWLLGHEVLHILRCGDKMFYNPDR